MKWSFIVFCIYIASLCFREERLPRFVIDRVLDRLSSGDVVVSCDSAVFGLRSGLEVRGLKVFDRGKSDPLLPVFSAKSVAFDYLARRLIVAEPVYPRLPDSYYEPGNQERNSLIEAEFPELGEYELRVIRPNVLGIEPKRLTGTLKISRHRIEVADITIDWPDQDRHMAVDGFTYIDLDLQRVYGEVRGTAMTYHIRPLLVTIDEEIALPYMDGFTEVPEPVPSFCSWDINLVNSDFKLKLDLRPTLGRYNGVMLKSAVGEIGLDNFIRGTNLNYNTTVGPIKAYDHEGRVLDGTIVFRGRERGVNLEFDASSNLPLKDTLDIIGYLNDGTLDCLRCDTPPTVTVKGTLAAELERQRDNDLRGSASFAKGSFFGIPVSDVKFDYAYVGDEISFTNVVATGKDGGRVSGSGVIRAPGLVQDNSTFALHVDYANGSLNELSDALMANFDGMSGKVNGVIDLTGPISTNVFPRLNGSGSMTISEGYLAELPLFMGLTKILSEKVPGVSFVVIQSQAGFDFTITDGVFASDDISIEGGIFSVKAWGTYDIPDDNLDFTVRVQLFKNDNFLSKLLQTVTLPFTKMLLEFKVTGSANAPDWKYISVIDRVL